MVTLTITELKERDPRQFDKEYYEWLEYASDYDWHSFHTDHFKEEMAKLGLTVDAVDLDGDHYNRFDAIVRGNMPFHVLLKHLKMDEVYLPLYLDALDTRVLVVFSIGWRSRQTVEVEELYSYESRPQGVFSDMEPTDWQELVEEQFNAEDWEQLALDWLTLHTDKLTDDLEKDYECITSEEAFIESCEANNITFEVEEDEI